MVCGNVERMSAFGIISDKSGDFRKLCSKLGVEKLELFGSGAREEFDPAKSDLDFIVSFFRDHRMGLADRYLELAEGLESLFSRKVDLLTVGAIKNPILRRNIERSKRLVYVGE